MRPAVCSTASIGDHVRPSLVGPNHSSRHRRRSGARAGRPPVRPSRRCCRSRRRRSAVRRRRGAAQRRQRPAPSAPGRRRQRSALPNRAAHRRSSPPATPAPASGSCAADVDQTPNNSRLGCASPSPEAPLCARPLAQEPRMAPSRLVAADAAAAMNSARCACARCTISVWMAHRRSSTTHRSAAPSSGVTVDPNAGEGAQGRGPAEGARVSVEVDRAQVVTCIRRDTQRADVAGQSRQRPGELLCQASHAAASDERPNPNQTTNMAGHRPASVAMARSPRRPLGRHRHAASARFNVDSYGRGLRHSRGHLTGMFVAR